MCFRTCRAFKMRLNPAHPTGKKKHQNSGFKFLSKLPNQRIIRHAHHDTSIRAVAWQPYEPAENLARLDYFGGILWSTFEPHKESMTYLYHLNPNRPPQRPSGKRSSTFSQTPHLHPPSRPPSPPLPNG